MKEDMVLFPGATGGWEDSGEGGLYVVLGVVEPIDWETDCIVDVYTTVQRNLPKDAKRSTTIRMSEPDVCVTPELRGYLWSDWDHQRFQVWFNAAKELRGRGKVAEAQWVDRATHQDDLSRSMLATAFLGSSSGSWYSEERGHYFNATFDDLTPKGKALYEMFETMYGIEPVIMTFLDT